MTILIVEDEKILADSIKTMLEGRGFQAEAVYDGETGADYAELGVYDLLILDVMMPKMDGYQVARRVRSRRCGTPPSTCASFWPASTPCSGGREIKWTRWSSGIHRWIWRRPCWSAGKRASACPPRSLT